MKSASIRLLVSGLLAWSAAWADPTLVANTGYIHGPLLVSAGMANITVTVPAQPGASYTWSIQGGALTGALHNAAAVFTAGAAGTARLSCLVTLNGSATQYS